MSDERTCIRGCVVREDGKPVHYASCAAFGTPDSTACKGCVPRPCRDGSYWCDGCFGRARRLMDDLPDLWFRLQSKIDPTTATPLDELRVRVSATEPPAAVKSDPLDALTNLAQVARLWDEAGCDLHTISNDLAVAEWMSVHVLDRHPAVDGIREAWSLQDTADQWRERKTDTYVFPDEDDGEEVTFVPEWKDRLLIKIDAEREAGSARTLRRWVKDGLIEPAGRMRYGNVVTPWYRYSEIVRIRQEMRANLSHAAEVESTE